MSEKDMNFLSALLRYLPDEMAQSTGYSSEALFGHGFRFFIGSFISARHNYKYRVVTEKFIGCFEI